MKNFFRLAHLIIILAFLSLAPSSFATSGACSSHGGVDCSAGPDEDGSVICFDGWRNSSVSYSSMTKCGPFFEPTPFIPSCPAFSSYSSLTSSCICHQGYAEIDGMCLDSNLYCQKMHGERSEYNSFSGSCQCQENYVLQEGMCVFREPEDQTELKPAASPDENLEKLYGYYKIRYQIGCLNYDDNDARCFWPKIELLYTQEALNKNELDLEISSEDVQRIHKKIGFLENRFQDFCTEEKTEYFCAAIEKLIDRANYFLSSYTPVLK